MHVCVYDRAFCTKREAVFYDNDAVKHSINGIMAIWKSHTLRLSTDLMHCVFHDSFLIEPATRLLYTALSIPPV